MLQKNNTIFNPTILKVLKPIFDFPNNTYHLRALERKTKLSTTAVRDSLNTLKKLEIVKIKKTPIITEIKSNFGNENYRFYKQLFNLYEIKRYKLVEQILKDFPRPECIVLFGSYSKGEDVGRSDIDIVVKTNSKKLDIENKEKLEKKFNRKISIHSLKDFGKSAKEFINALSNGYVLYGYFAVYE